MKKLLLFTLFNLITIILIAQSSIRLNNDWTKTYIINPASITDQYFAEFNLADRQQWVGFEGSPNTLFASGTIYLDDLYTQFGLKIVQDKIGFTSNTDIDLTYAYSMRVNNNWRMNMGLGISFQNSGYDISKVKSPTANDPTVYSRLLNENYINSDTGVELTNKIWKIGFASQNIFSLFSPANKQFENVNFAYFTYREYNHDFLNLGFGACAIQYSNLYQMEFNLSGYFKKTNASNPFQFSFIYRTWSEFGVLFGLEISPNFGVSYSYDYNFSGISRASFGSQELMLTYKLDRIYKCRNCWY